MVELKFKRTACRLDPKECFLAVKNGPLQICKRRKKDYLIIGHTKNCGKKDKEILAMLFGDEVVYTDREIMVPRNFFFV